MAVEKYREIFEKLQEDISQGRYGPGDRLPNEGDLIKRFGVSRMTVFRAMQELQSHGFVTRKVGSGTYVSEAVHPHSYVFGLLIPELGQTEIFGAICQGMMEAPRAMHHSLLWGNNADAKDKDREEVAQQMCQHYISRKVSGIFFAPVEYSSTRFEANHRITEAFDKAGIPVVLLDRCLEPYPKRSKFDLVGIDNRRTAFHATEHLIGCGAKRIAFFARPNSAPTVDARVAGYREALFLKSAGAQEDIVRFGDAQDEQYIRSILVKDRPDAFLCANDLTAGHLMRSLISLGRRIPEDIRIMGFDDVNYASLLPVPLTTERQPCREIGRIALSTMLDRIENPDLPPRDLLLGCELIVRSSCGSQSQPLKRHAGAVDLSQEASRV